MVWKGFLLFLGVFLLGWIANGAYSSIATAAEQPAGLSIVTGKVTEKPSPKNRVADEQIKVYEDKVIIYLDHPKWATFTDTNSMDPVLDAEANAIQIQPLSADDIQVGDIISYRNNEETIIHRVIETGTDEGGWYCIVKGDNNPMQDPKKVRFEQITRILIGIIY